MPSKIFGIGPFDYTQFEENCGVEWKNWHRSFEWYLKANHIEDDEDKFLKLMHLAGPKVQELFSTLVPSSKIDTVGCGPLASGFVAHPTQYDKTVAALNEFFEPKKNSTYERHMFRLIKQEPGEKIGIFAMKLRTQAEKCDFGDLIEDHIKDQIIEKCLSTKLRRELLKIGDAKLDHVLKTAKIFETIEEQSKTFDQNGQKPPTTVEGISKIDSKSSFRQNTNAKDKTVECTRCGFMGHRSFDDKCPAKGKTCNKCGGRDHFSRKCRTKKRPRDNQKDTKNKFDGITNTKTEKKDDTDESATKKNKSEETVKLVESYQPNLKNEYIFCVENSTKNDNEIGCKIGGVEMTVVIDSGSKFNIVGSDSWEFLKEKKVVVTQQQKEVDQVFKAYGGHNLTTIGCFEAKIDTDHKSCYAKFYVLQNHGKVLIGRDTGIPLGVLKIGENVNQIEQHSKQQLSKIKGFIIDIPIDKSVKPVAQPYRRVPVPLEEAVDNKIEELLEAGIIEKVNEPSAWISPIVPVPKNGEVRVCLDMRRANEAVLRENHPLPTMEEFLPHIGKGKVFTKLDVKNAYHQV